jgi:hypothetical protein
MIRIKSFSRDHPHAGGVGEVRIEATAINELAFPDSQRLCGDML